MRRSSHWRCLWSRLTSCTWTGRRTGSLVGRAMRRSSHWRCHWSRLTGGLLLEVETSRSSRLASLVALWGRGFTQFYDWPRLSAHQTRRIPCEFEWAMYPLIFDLVGWFQSFVYTRWSAHESESFVYSRWVSSRGRRVSVCTVASRLDQSQ